MKKIIKRVTDVVLILMIVYLAVLFLPKVFKISPYQVLSGSMEPAYHVGSLVYVKDVTPETIQVGDTITFHLTGDTIVTHRVIEKDESSQAFHTKGDANENADGGEVKFSAVIGKVVFTIPVLGYVYSYMASGLGMIVVVTVLAILLILSFLLDYLSKEEGDAKNEKVSEKQ